MLDSFFTPAPLAARMVEVAQGKHDVIADFAAGDGRLLTAALKQWKQAQVIACDINVSVVSKLRRLEPKWRVGQCDFLSDRSRRHCLALKDAPGNVSLALLNPPFSYRGAHRWVVNLPTESLSCSQAMAFVLVATTFLHREGEVVAVIPAGSLLSQRDQTAWNYLRDRYLIDVVQSNGHLTFEGCFPKTAIVHLYRGKKRRTGRVPLIKSAREMKVEIVRGSLPMHKLDPTLAKGIPLVHSTNLRSDPIQASGYVSPLKTRTIIGPAVLMPRVGMPDVNKLRTYHARKRIGLSDCVIGLKCQSGPDAEYVKRLLTKQWKNVEREYGGTCARYITLASLQEVLRRLNVKSTIAD